MLTDEELMLLVQLEYLDPAVEAAAGVVIEDPQHAIGGPSRDCEGVRVGGVAGIVGSFDETALQRLERCPERGNGLISGEEWSAILRAIRDDEKLMELELWGKDSKVFASCYLDRDGHAYVTFRGTATGEEWVDNVEGAYGISTQSQEEALAYVESLPFGRITVAGHSKGGNKAQFVALLSEKVERCVSMDGQGFSGEFLESCALQIGDNSRKIRNYSLSTDYVHVHLYAVPGAEQIYCQGEKGLAGVRNHSSAAFYQFFRDQNGDMRIAMNERGQTNLIRTTENEGIQYLHRFTCFLLETMPEEKKAQAIRYLGNVLALAMRDDYSLTVEGETFAHDSLKAYIFSDQETAALMLAYLLKYAEVNELSETQFLSLLDAFALKETYVILKMLTERVLGPFALEKGKTFGSYLLSAVKDDRRNLVIEASLGLVHRAWLGKHMEKRVGRDVSPRKLWRDVQREYLLIPE